MITVAIYSDGLGTFQARCTDCSWRGRWYRSEDRAVAEAKTHQEHRS